MSHLKDQRRPFVVRSITPVSPELLSSAAEPATATIPTRILLLSDTHARVPLRPAPEGAPTFYEPRPLPSQQQQQQQSAVDSSPATSPAIDVVIHSGDLTNSGLREEYLATLELLESVHAGLKLVIAGNHDVTLDESYLKANVKWSMQLTGRTLDAQAKAERAAKEGHEEWLQEELKAARELWTGERARKAGVVYLEEGVRTFELRNGAKLTVYASPYSPEFCNWAFAYPRTQDRYNNPSQSPQTQTQPPPPAAPANPIPSFPSIDILITHGPPFKILDKARNNLNVGCPFLYEAVRRCRPRLHVFGHIHEDWGVERIDWRKGVARRRMFGGEDEEDEEDGEDWVEDGVEDEIVQVDLTGEEGEGEGEGEEGKLRFGEETLFVNAAVMNGGFMPLNAPWVVQLLLPASTITTTLS